MSAANRKLTILFLCTGNSCRSQMAEGWTRHLKNDVLEAWSAGLEKHGINTLAVKVMAEAGIDISLQQSKRLEELPRQHFDFVVTLCDHAGEHCPYFPGKTVHRPFPDPPRLAAAAASEAEALVYYRQVRDQIRDFIATLPESLT